MLGLTNTSNLFSVHLLCSGGGNWNEWMTKNDLCFCIIDKKWLAFLLFIESSLQKGHVNNSSSKYCMASIVKACQNQIHISILFWITYVKFSINNKTLHKTIRVIHTIWRPAILKLWWQGPLKISFTFFFFLLNTDIFFTWCFYINKSFTWKTN